MKRTCSLLLLLIFTFVNFASCSGANGALNASSQAVSETTSAGETAAATEKETAKTAAAPAEGKLAIEYIDVGQADSALLQCGGKAMLIDGGNVADSSLVASVLKKRGISFLDVVVNTHAHEDHVGGLSGALSVAKAGRVFAPKTGANSKAYTNFVKKVQAQGKKIETPKPGQKLNLGGAVITFLAPVDEKQAAADDDLNNTSIVLRVDFGKTSFLFMGDAALSEETQILDAGENVKCNVLKVGHHGSGTSTGYRFLREASPKYAIISVGKNNSYGHPSDDTLSRLRDAGVAVYRTDLKGDVIVSSDGKKITVSAARGTSAESNAASAGTKEKTTAAPENAYIGNLNGKTFHRPTCKHLPKAENRIYFADKKTALEEGYKPCSYCRP